MQDAFAGQVESCCDGDAPGHDLPDNSRTPNHTSNYKKAFGVNELNLLHIIFDP